MFVMSAKYIVYVKLFFVIRYEVKESSYLKGFTRMRNHYFEIILERILLIIKVFVSCL